MNSYNGLAVTLGLLAAFLLMPKGEVDPTAPYFIIGGFLLMFIAAGISAYQNRNDQ